jgi:hypothetical protein
MKRIATYALAMTGATLLATSAIAQDTDSAAGVKIGTLTCSVEEETSFIVGSNATLNCIFDPAGSAQQSATYTGTINDYGLDIGSTSNATLVWGVLAPSADMEKGALEGAYGGVTAGATLGAGVKANALVGGFRQVHRAEPGEPGKPDGRQYHPGRYPADAVLHQLIAQSRRPRRSTDCRQTPSIFRRGFLRAAPTVRARRQTPLRGRAYRLLQAICPQATKPHPAS